MLQEAILDKQGFLLRNYPAYDLSVCSDNFIVQIRTVGQRGLFPGVLVRANRTNWSFGQRLNSVIY